MINAWPRCCIVLVLHVENSRHAATGIPAAGRWQPRLWLVKTVVPRGFLVRRRWSRAPEIRKFRCFQSLFVVAGVHCSLFNLQRKQNNLNIRSMYNRSGMKHRKVKIPRIQVHIDIRL